jgi:predicted DNA-binding protein (MmcQ/YjbR family)
MLRILIISFSLILYFASCDYLNKSPEKLVGKVYLWSTDGSNRKILNLKTGESSYSPLEINGTVSTALANDSLIYITGEFQELTVYYLIEHENGEKIINIKIIDSVSFIKFEQSKNFKYAYHSK